ncbi:MAG TPA: EAL domain-containing protein [Euzebyales bacterium]|nr:EAL domain-containing protein [Euzebyales bacterium]
MQARETAGITTRLIIEEMRRWGGDEAVERLLELAGLSEHATELTDERVWWSYDTKIALFAAAADLTGEPRIARDMGAALLRSRVGRSLLPVLTLLGSPAHLLRSIGRAGAKFTTVADLELASCGRRSATVSYRLHPGYPPSRYDCDLNIGLLSHVSAIFGLPPATVRHVECQVDGAERCAYHLSWRARRRWWRRPAPTMAASDVQARFDALQQTVADLVGATDVDAVLPAIARRAGDAVHAQRFLIAVEVDGDERPRWHSEGFTAEEANELGGLLLAGRPLPADRGAVLAAPLRSARRDYGVLAAFVRGPHGFLESEQELLQSYARLGASALDAATAVTAAQRGQQTAEVLLGFSRQLLTTEGSTAVTHLTADAARSIVGCDRSSVWLWDAEDRALRLAGQAGWDEGDIERMRTLAIRPDETPELAALLADPTRPRLYDLETAGPHLRQMITSFANQALAVVPMALPSRLVGVVIAAWRSDAPRPVVDESLFARMAGVADQATTALQRAALLEQVQRQASRDELTGLANRRTFGLLLDETLRQVTATHTAGLLFLDLDRFKHVNDTLGHNAGDALLQMVARRLQECVRTDDVVARLGGDEFTVLLSTDRGDTELHAVADKILRAFAEPVRVDGQPVLVRPSIGGVVISADRTDPTALLRDADVAMYAAKRAGGGRMIVYDDAYRSDFGDLALEAELHHAITIGQLAVVYQPQVDLATGDVVGAEALVRWDHPQRGRLVPGQFLPLAEETGLIVEIDLLVLRCAVREAARWRRQRRPLRVAVNVSARTLADDQLLPTILGQLDETGLPADALELELSESGAFADPERVNAAIAALRGHGVSLALDDLGAGHNALRRVQELPVRRLKIDRAFVADMPVGGPGAHVVEAIIRLGERLGVPVLAEGVETPREADALRAAGCQQAQGYLYGYPADPADLPFAGRVGSSA